MCNSGFPVLPSFCKFWFRNRCYKCISFDVSICRNLCLQVLFWSGTVSGFRSHRWLQIWKWSRPLATLILFCGLSFLQSNDVSDSFAFDIMSCSPTLDKCDKFGDYFCSTYLETTIFPPSLALGASSVWCTSYYTIYRRVSDTFTAECIGFTLTVMRLVCDVGILCAERYFVILDFFFVILDVLKIISET